MLKVYQEIQSVRDFDAWGGAADRLEFYKRNEFLIDYLDGYLVGQNVGDFWEDEELNDFIWFYADDVLADAGYLDDDGELAKAWE